MSEFQAILPILGPSWNAEQFFASCGEVPIPFLLIDNSPTGDSKNLSLPKNVEVELHPDNLGTSISWNLGLMRGAKWTLILSASTRFGDGGLTRYIEEARHWANDYGFYSPIGGHCHVIGKEMVKRIGLIDCNLHPAYIEDRDLGRRIDVSSINPSGSMPVFRARGLHIVGSAIAVGSGLVKDQRIAEREAYYLQKWGGPQNQEKFLHPFGDQPLSYFPRPEFLRSISMDVYDSACKGMDWYAQTYGHSTE